MTTVRNFADITETSRLKKFLESKSGTLYFDTVGPEPTIIVRHFDRDLPPELVRHFVELTSEARRWLEQHPDAARWIAIEPVIEFGVDFTARRHHVYYQSLRSYDEPDEDAPIDPPDELAPMREAVRTALGHAEGERAQIVEDVIARSLLGSTGKTYLGQDRFIIVELTPTRAELERFASAP